MCGLGEWIDYNISQKYYNCREEENNNIIKGILGSEGGRKFFKKEFELYTTSCVVWVNKLVIMYHKSTIVVVRKRAAINKGH